MNFSSATSPELLLKTFDHYCEYRRTPNGLVLAPVQLGKWMVLFCDEINLPDMDSYGKIKVKLINKSAAFNVFNRKSMTAIYNNHGTIECRNTRERYFQTS